MAADRKDIVETTDTTPRRRRKLSAIMMADVKGFSAMMGTDEDATVDLIKAFHDRVRTLVHEFEGRIVDTAGDSVFCEFDSVVNAVRCARRIQEDQAAVNRERTDGGQVHTRIGVHLGDVIVEDYHVYGDGVNIAARLEPLADPGGICLSEAVYQQIRNKLDIPLEDLGVRQLKNIQYPIRLYRVPPPELLNGEPPPTTAPPPPSSGPAPAPPAAAAPAVPPVAPAPAATGPGAEDAANLRDSARTIGKAAARTFKREAKEAARAIKAEAKKIAREAKRSHAEFDAERKPRDTKRGTTDVGAAAGKLGQDIGRAAGKMGAEVSRAATAFGEHVAEVVPPAVDAAVHTASAAAEEALRSALGKPEGTPATPPSPPAAPAPPAEQPHERIDAALQSWTRDLRRAGTLIPLIVGVFLVLSPVILFDTAGVFPTGGSILIAVCLGGVWARRAGRPGNFMLALGAAIASGAMWTNWSSVTNTLLILAGVIVAAVGASSSRHRKSHGDRREHRRARRQARRDKRRGRHRRDDDE